MHLVKYFFLAFPYQHLYNEPLYTNIIQVATVAQVAEQAFRKRQVKGSSPFGGFRTQHQDRSCVLF